MKKILLIVSAILIGSASYAQYAGFENWTLKSVQTLDNYRTSANERGDDGAKATFPSTDAQRNTKSIRLETVIGSNGDTVFGYFVSGDPEDNKPGQVTAPLNGVDSLIGWYKYDIKTGDSCVIAAQTFMAGITTGGGIFHILAGQQTTWKRFSYPINAPTSDSLMIAIAGGNPLNKFNGIVGTWIQFDDIKLKKGGQEINIVNGDFENWSSMSWEVPDNWNTSNIWAFGESALPVTKTATSYSGSYALELTTLASVNHTGDTLWAGITNGMWSDNGPIGGQPYSVSPTAVECYYKYTPTGSGDGVRLNIEFKKNGSVIGNYGNYFTTAEANYTHWTQPITPMTPDTVLITISNNRNFGSKFTIDNLDFLFPVGVSEHLKVEKLVSYPNPATDVLKIKFNLIKENNVSIRLIDILGKELVNRHLGNLSSGEYREIFNTSSFDTGVYFIEFTLGNEKVVERFVVK